MVTLVLTTLFLKTFTMFSAAGGYNRRSTRTSDSIINALGHSTVRVAAAGSCARTPRRSSSKRKSRTHSTDSNCQLSETQRNSSASDVTANHDLIGQGREVKLYPSLKRKYSEKLQRSASSKSERLGTFASFKRRLSSIIVPNSRLHEGNPSLLRVDSSEHDCIRSGCKRIRLNVSGQYYDTFVGLLDRHPDTLLGNASKRKALYDSKRDEYFIDRHRPSFEAVFEYYQHGGKLKRPHNVPDDIFLAEILYYELENDVIDEYKDAEGYTQEDIVLPKHETLRKIWILFEFPEPSWEALIIAILSVVMTIASIVLFCVETLPRFALTHCVEDAAPNFLDPFFLIETTCTMWFTIELLIRFIACPDKLLFWKDFKNIVDLTAIIPYYVTLINVLSTMSCASAKSSASLAFLRVIRLVRVFKLTKHSVGLQILILTFKASLEGLGLFLIALIVCLLVFSSAIYFAELGVKGSQIHSIPDAFWWAIITMTTVGYGDQVPVGPWGKLIGSFCAVVGVLTLAIPVPIITGNFNRFYAHKTGRGRPG